MFTLQLSAVIGSYNYQNYQNYQPFRLRYSCFPRRPELGRASCRSALGTLVSPDVLNSGERLRLTGGSRIQVQFIQATVGGSLKPA